MSKIASLLQEKKAAKPKLIASTIRIPEETYSFIDELAEHLGLSKQETMATLIHDGVEAAKSAMRLDELMEDSSECSYHLLNTNKRNNAADTDRMLEEGIAAAFYSPWKLNIDRIKPDDVVFLYENGVGIIAFGYATGERLVRDYNGDSGEFFYQKLTDFVKLKEAIPASEVKSILNANIVFLRTMVSISEGNKLLEVVKTRV
jgi:predicted DNA-binding protein